MCIRDSGWNVKEIDGHDMWEILTALDTVEKNGRPTVIIAHTVKGKGVSFAEKDVYKRQIRYRNTHGFAHIPEDRQKYGLVLDYPLEKNCVIQRYFEPAFQRRGFIRRKAVRQYAEKLIKQFDIRSGQGPDVYKRQGPYSL